MRLLVITGAGVSAESGIPTFRGRDGYWRNLDPMKLATPEAFARDPQLVWQWYRERRRRIRDAQPNPAHTAIARLAQRAEELLLVTQNVDDLHARAGLAKEKIVQIHGNVFTTRCSRCAWSAETCGDGNDNDEPAKPAATPRSINDALVRCPKCNALARPGVVWFGEQLPWHEVQRVEDYLARGGCDAVIVAGTTALFGYISDWALRASRGGGQLIEVNPEETALSAFATQRLREPAATALPRIVDEWVSCHRGEGTR